MTDNARGMSCAVWRNEDVRSKMLPEGTKNRKTVELETILFYNIKIQYLEKQNTKKEKEL